MLHALACRENGIGQVGNAACTAAIGPSRTETVPVDAEARHELPPRIVRPQALACAEFARLQETRAVARLSSPQKRERRFGMVDRYRLVRAVHHHRCAANLAPHWL